MFFKKYNKYEDSTNKLLFLGLLILPIQTFIGILILLYVGYQGWKNNWQEIKSNYLTYSLIIVTFLLIISAIFAYKSGEAWLGIVHFLPFFCLFLGLRYTITNFERLYWLILPLIFNSIVVVILAIGEVNFHWVTMDLVYKLFGWQLTGEGIPPGRASSVFPYANPLALYLAITIIFSLGLLISRWQKSALNRVNLLLILSILFNSYGLILTGSRNGWILVFLSIIAFAIYCHLYSILSLIIASGIIVSWASFGNLPLQDFWREIVPDIFWKRFSDQLYISGDRPLETLRTTQWNFCLDLIKKRPFFGWGLRNFSILYEEKMGIYLGHPHNFFLMISAETGLITLIGLLLLIGWIIWRGCLVLIKGKIQEEKKVIFFSYLLAFIAYIIYNLFDVGLFDLRLNILAWIILAAISGISENKLRENQE